MTDSFWGNYTGGLNAINGVGQQLTARRAGGQLATGNRRAAANTLLQSGDLQGGLALEAQTEERAAADQARQIQFTLQATQALRRARESGQDVLSAYDSMAPAFQQMGTDPAQIAQMRQALGTNPDQFLQSVEQIAGQQARQLDIQNLGEGYAVAIDRATGEEVNRYERPRVPQRVAVGNDYIEVGPDGAVRPLYQGAREPEYRQLTDETGAETIVALGGRPGRVVGGGAAAESGADVLGVLQEVIPGVTFNSGTRTPEQNRAAGGVPNSFHVRGRAVDIPPQQGRSPAQLRAELEARGVQVEELIDEGDHWHIAWGNNQRAPNFGRGETLDGGGGGARVVARGGVSPAVARAARTEEAAERRAARQDRGDSRQLRRDFEALPDVKDYRTVETAYQQVQRLSQNSGNPADDVALTFSFMKMLDPGSVVREGEYALVGRAQGLTGRALVALQRIDSGEALTPALRADLRETAGRVLESRRARYEALVQQYRGYAEEDGFDPNRVVPLSPPVRAATGPRLRFTPTPEQLSRSQQIVRSRPSEGRRGEQTNPILINPADPTTSYGNVRSGQYYITPTGEVRRKP